MPLYEYRAVDGSGAAVTGTMEERSAYRVTSLLGERGLQVNDVARVDRRAGLIHLTARLGWDDLHFLNEQLLAITRSGLPLTPALKNLAQDLHRPRLRRALEALHREVDRGRTLEEAVLAHREYFPALYASIIRAGERSGNLPGVLAILTDYSGRQLEVRNRVQTAAAYPLLVLLISALVIVFLNMRVVPHFAAIFAEFGQGLPGPTRFWIGTSQFVSAHLAGVLMFIAVLFGLGVALAIATSRWQSMGIAFDWLKTKLPVVGKVYYAGSVARFSRTLGLLLASRVPVLESLDLAAAGSGNALLRRAVYEASPLVAQGLRIADALESTRFFGHSFCWLLAVGEERGEAEVSLLSLADSYERQMAGLDRMISVLLSPLLIVVVGGVIGFMVLSLYLPIFTLGDAISGN
jgi:type IV pilus assembly protein PilC